MAVITESRGDLLQLVARPGAGATYRSQCPLHEFVSLQGQFHGRWSVRRPIGQDSFHMAAIIRQSRLDGIKSFRCHGLPELCGGFVDQDVRAHQNCDCLGRYMDWNRPVKYESCCSIWAIAASAAAILAWSELCSWLILSRWSEIN